MVDLTVLKFKLEIIIRSVVDASGGPRYFRVNCGPKGRKICFFWRPPPLPQGLDDQATSFSQGLDPPVNIKYCYIAGISSPTACGLIGYFKVMWWYLTIKFFPAKSFWAGNIAKSMTSVGNSALLPANVDRRPPFRFVFTLRLLGIWYFAEKKQNFAGFSGANSRKNRPISRDFRGRKVKIRRKIGRFRGILAKKSQISTDFQGKILKKIGRFHGKFRGKTSPRNNL